MNSALYNLYNSFPARLETPDSDTGSNYSMLVFPLMSINEIQLSGETYVVLPQEFSTIMAWSPFTSIVLTSNTLPVRPNIVNPALVYSDNQLVSQGDTSSTSNENIITDLTSSDGGYHSGLTYTPTAEYRMIDLLGNEPISNLDLNIYYRQKNGKLIPYRMSAGDGMSIKIDFFKNK